MPYKNLKVEMAREGVTVEAISKMLNMHRNSVSNKINGKSRFTVDEAKLVKETFFQI